MSGLFSSTIHPANKRPQSFLHPTMFTQNEPKYPSAPGSRVFVCKGLEGQDENIELLEVYFRDLKTITVDPSMDPDLDMLTFALGAHYFGVIMLEEFESVPRHNQPNEDSQPRVHIPEVLPSDQVLDEAELKELNILTPMTETQILAMPTDEQDRLWREAFREKMVRRLDDDDDIVQDDAVMRERRKNIPFREGDIDLFEPDEEELELLKGAKIRKQGRRPKLAPIAPSVNDHLINWPEDIAPDDSVHNGDITFSASTNEPLSPLGFDGFGYPELPHERDEPIGREYFEPDMGPAPNPVVIPQDQKIGEMVEGSVINLQKQMRARTVHMYQMKLARIARNRAVAERAKGRNGAGEASTSSMVDTMAQSEMVIRTRTRKAIGLAYLTSSQTFSDPLHMGECSIGIYIAPEYRSMGQVSVAINMVVEDAFRDQDCRRLQAILVDHPDILDFLSLFAAAGFRREGIRRRAFFSQISNEWKDVTYLAILATEWVHDQHNTNSRARLLPSSLWDEVLSRHQREQEEIIKMEEKKSGLYPGSLKRRVSAETIRQITTPTSLSRESGGESSGFSTDASSGFSSPRRRKFGFMSEERRTSFSSSESGFESDWEMASLDDGSLASFSMYTSSPFPPSTVSLADESPSWDFMD